jgi:hypothetical protein
MGKQVPGVTQDNNKAAEFTDPRLMDKTPIYLSLFPWQKGEAMISLLFFPPKGLCMLNHTGIAYFYPSFFQPPIDLNCFKRWVFGKPMPD